MVQHFFFDMIKQRDHKYATPLPLPAVVAVKTPVGAVAKNTQNCFHGGGVAYLWLRCLIMSKKK